MTDLRATLLLIALGLAPVGVLVGIRHALAGMSTLAALERIPVHKSDLDEPADERRVRLAEIAGAIDAVARDRSLRVWAKTETK